MLQYCVLKDESGERVQLFKELESGRKGVLTLPPSSSGFYPALLQNIQHKNERYFLGLLCLQRRVFNKESTNKVECDISVGPHGMDRPANRFQKCFNTLASIASSVG